MESGAIPFEPPAGCYRVAVKDRRARQAPTLLVGIWTMVTTVVATRQALDITTGNAIIVSIIGVIAAAVATGIIVAALAIPAIAVDALG
jgi:K+-sensing histidine kinase KdpD